MYSATFTLEAITPVFMRGANQSKAEIRAASIKGLMRWWFRALAGSYFGNDVEELRRAEEYVFGSTKRESRVVVEVEAPDPSKLHFKPGKIDGRTRIGELRYLWFSIQLLSRRGQFQYYYPEGTKFELKILSGGEKELNLALLSLWALVTLGGVGFRSRRGAGSLTFERGDLNLFEKLGLRTNFKNIEELRNSIGSAVRTTGDLLNRVRVEWEDGPSYPVLSSRTCCIALWDPGTGDVFEALKRFERTYANFRSQKISKPERVVFGLPLKLGGKGVKDIESKLEILNNSRRASPMMVGAIGIGKKLYLKIVKFKTCFYPSKEIKEVAKWDVLKNFNDRLREVIVYGSPDIFKEVFP